MLLDSGGVVREEKEGLRLREQSAGGVCAVDDSGDDTEEFLTNLCRFMAVDPYPLQAGAEDHL